jgi:DNA-binding PadR family transcriptional regulator
MREHPHAHNHGHPFAEGRGGGPPFDPGFGGRRGRGRGGPGGPWRGGRMRRGDIRPLLLTALLEGPAHGYELIRRLEERSGGMWKPSPGSVYPTLQLLADEGAVTSNEEDGKRTFALTDEGRSEAEAAASTGPSAPWDEDPAVKGRFALREAVEQLHQAARQVAKAGGPDEVDKALEILRQARQGLYKILAEA